MYNTVAQQYFKYAYDVTSITMATTECLERTLQFPDFIHIRDSNPHKWRGHQAIVTYLPVTQFWTDSDSV